MNTKEFGFDAFAEENAANLLLDTIVAAHYLALQLQMLSRDPAFAGRDAAEFAASTLSEWARLAEKDRLARPDLDGAYDASEA